MDTPGVVKTSHLIGNQTLEGADHALSPHFCPCKR